MRPHQRVAALPVDLALDGIARSRQGLCAAEGVPDGVTLLDDVGHRLAAERACVVWLAAAGRIETGPVRRHPPRPTLDGDDGGGEAPLLGVVQVEQVGHCCLLVLPALIVARGVTSHVPDRRRSGGGRGKV